MLVVHVLIIIKEMFLLRPNKNYSKHYIVCLEVALQLRMCTVYWEIFMLQNFCEFHKFMPYWKN